MTVHCVRGGRLAGETSHCQAGAYFGCGSTLAKQLSDLEKAPGAGDNSFLFPLVARSSASSRSLPSWGVLHWDTFSCSVGAPAPLLSSVLSAWLVAAYCERQWLEWGETSGGGGTQVSSPAATSSRILFTQVLPVPTSVATLLPSLHHPEPSLWGFPPSGEEGRSSYPAGRDFGRLTRRLASGHLLDNAEEDRTDRAKTGVWVRMFRITNASFTKLQHLRSMPNCLLQQTNRRSCV